MSFSCLNLCFKVFQQYIALLLRTFTIFTYTVCNISPIFTMCFSVFHDTFIFTILNDVRFFATLNFMVLATLWKEIPYYSSLLWTIYLYILNLSLSLYTIHDWDCSVIQNISPCSSLPRMYLLTVKRSVLFPWDPFNVIMYDSNGVTC